MARLRRLIIKIAATRMTIRITTAPPIIPPISGVVRPLLPVPEALIFKEAVCEGVYFPTTPLGWTVSVESGAPRMVDEMMVVVMVCGIKLASVVVRVSVRENVEMLVT